MANNMQPMWLHYLDYNHRVLKTHNSDFLKKKCKVLFFSLKTLNFELFFNSDFFLIRTFLKKIWLFFYSDFKKNKTFFKFRLF